MKQLKSVFIVILTIVLFSACKTQTNDAWLKPRNVTDYVGDTGVVDTNYFYRSHQ